MVSVRSRGWYRPSLPEKYLKDGLVMLVEVLRYLGLRIVRFLVARLLALGSGFLLDVGILDLGQRGEGRACLRYALARKAELQLGRRSGRLRISVRLISHFGRRLFFW